MNRRLTTVLLIAFAIASLSGWLVYRIVGARLRMAKPVATTRVVAAAKDISLGAVLTSADLTTMQLESTPPKGAILKPEDAIGRGAITQISQGEPILDSFLAGYGSGGGLAPTIPQGMRACAIKVDQVVGVAGFVIPGMRVDVLVSGNPLGTGTSQADEVTKTILQNIQVLSAGTDIQRDEEGKPQQVQVVNLLVTPEQAEQLSLASNSLKIQLVLRNPLDTQVAVVPPTAMSSLFGVATPAPRGARRAARPAAKPFTIVVINGNKTTEQKFASPEGQH
ncbi:MAG: Flp pilus assembly protein CpaB [Terracidiphilus sp.]